MTRCTPYRDRYGGGDPPIAALITRLAAQAVPNSQVRRFAETVTLASY